MIEIPSGVVATIRSDAMLGAIKGGDPHAPENRAYVQHCNHLHWNTGTIAIFTRVIEPDYGHLLALSLSFREPRAAPSDVLAKVHLATQLGAMLPLRPFDRELASAWIDLLYAPDQTKSWRMRKVSEHVSNRPQIEVWVLPTSRDWQPRNLDDVVTRQLMAIGWERYEDVRSAATA